MVTRLCFYITAIFIFPGTLLKAQNYQALHGSSFAGGLGVANNPASIVNVPWKWDVTPLAAQVKHTTNAFTVQHFSLFSSSSNANVQIGEGAGERYLMANQDMHLFNTRIRLNGNSAIAFGANLRSMESVKTSGITWMDSIKSVRQFMGANISNSPLETQIRAASWAELYGSYARTLTEHDRGKLVGGITIKVNRGLAGGYASGSGLYEAPGQVHGQNGFLLSNGSVSYGYSSNLDLWDSAGTNQAKRKRFLQKTWSALSISLGVEYLIPSADEDEYSYDLKIGASLLDVGYNKFQYSPNSRSAVMNKANVSDSLIEKVFENINSAGQVPDSLASIAGSIKSLNGFFKIFQPARLVLNADKRIAGNLFINAELVIPLTPLMGRNSLYVQDMNLAALTPRFETRAFGFYVPVTFTTRNQLWVGSALKAGPFLLGIHNWTNLFAKNKIQNGGAYLVLTIRPWKNNNRDEADGGQKNNNKEKSRRRSGNMGCPVNVQRLY